MSCMIINSETVSKVSYFIAMLLNQGFNSFGFCANKSLYEAFEDCRVGNLYDEDRIYLALYALNHKAYNGRYRLPMKENYEDEIPRNPGLRYWEVLERKVENFGGHCEEVVQNWHYAALKGVSRLYYQLLEDATEEDAKTVAMGQLEQRLALFIATHTPEYHKLPWC